MKEGFAQSSRMRKTIGMAAGLMISLLFTYDYLSLPPVEDLHKFGTETTARFVGYGRNQSSILLEIAQGGRISIPCENSSNLCARIVQEQGPLNLKVLRISALGRHFPISVTGASGEILPDTGAERRFTRIKSIQLTQLVICYFVTLVVFIFSRRKR